MAGKKKKSEAETLSEIIIQGIVEKKGLGITSMDLRNMDGQAVSDFFIVCHGTSRVHAEAIADSIEAEVKKKTGLNPWQREGLKNAEWILLDYVNVVAHIFQEKIRNFYNLEGLWADAEIKTIDPENKQQEIHVKTTRKKSGKQPGTQ